MSLSTLPSRTSSLRSYPRSSRPPDHLTILHLLLLVLSLLAAVPPCLCDDVRPRQLHNVWYSGLFISGIAVDEASGDVFFSDAAANRVVRQSHDGKLLDVYAHGFYSPSQLAYHNGTLYIADSTNNRVGWVDVASGRMTWAPPPFALTSCSSIAYNPPTSQLYVVDGWGLVLQVLHVSSEQWTRRQVALDGPPSSPLHYVSSITTHPQLLFGDIWLVDAMTSTEYHVLLDDVQYGFDLSSASNVSAVQLLPATVGSDSYTFYVLSQQAADQPMYITQLDIHGKQLSQWIAPGRGGGTVPFYGWAMFVDSNASMYISDHGVDAQSSPYGRVVKLLANGSEVGEWTMSDGVAYAFTSLAYDGELAAGGLCALWATDSERGLVRLAADGAVQPEVHAAPVDPADNRTAVFSGMSLDNLSKPPSWSLFNATLVLLDSSDPATTKLWSYRLRDHSFTLLNTSALAAARLGRTSQGVAVGPGLSDFIYLS